MEIHDVRALGHKDFSADVVSQLPQSPKPNSLYLLTGIDGENNPGLYVYVSDAWVCTSRLLISTTLPQAAAFESLCLLTAEYSDDTTLYLPGFYRRTETSWVRVSAFGAGTSLPNKSNVGDWYFILPGGTVAAGRYDCYAKNTWTHSSASALKARGGLLFDSLLGLYVAPELFGCDLSFFFQGKPAANVLVFARIFARPAVVDFSKSSMRSGVAATSAKTYAIRKNGSQIATWTISATSMLGTFAYTGSGRVSFASGDRIEVVASSTTDSTLAHLYGVFHAGQTL